MGVSTSSESAQPGFQLIRGRPAWEIARLYPDQGYWEESDYLSIGTNHMIEFDNGFIEVLPMPTLLHQFIVQFLFKALDAFVVAHATGFVFVAPLPVRLWPFKYREPDVVFVRPERIKNVKGQPDGADLVMEIVSEGAENRQRDLKTKPNDYARAGIAEYWVVDPEEHRITVLTLDGQAYRTHGEFGRGTRASSVMFPDFSVEVDAVFAAGERVQA
jgi:Uma2 family endonuclease